MTVEKIDDLIKLLTKKKEHNINVSDESIRNEVKRIEKEITKYNVSDFGNDLSYNETKNQ